MSDNDQIDSVWQRAVTLAWKSIPGTNGPHLDDETVAAYAEGNLTDDQLHACDEHLSRCPNCLALVEELWSNTNVADANMPSLRPADMRVGVRSGWLQRVVVAASLLLAVSGWSVVWYAQSVSMRLGDENARLKKQLSDVRSDLVLALKEEFIDAAPSPMNGFWSMSSSPRILQAPTIRGIQPLSPAGSARAERLRQTLETMLESPEFRGRAFLELASIEIIAGRMDAADSALRQANKLVGETAEWKNVRAVRLVASGDRNSVAMAEQLLRETIRDNPDFMPARYNLALLLQQSFREAECKAAWQEYLQHERRHEFRAVAKAQMPTP